MMQHSQHALLSRQEAASPLDGFSELVGAIYQCALEPSGWPAALERMRAEVAARAGWIAVHYPAEIRSSYQIEVGTDPVQQQRLREHYVPMSPFINLRHHELPDVISVDGAIDYDEFTAGRFFREWAEPQGFRDFIRAALYEAESAFTWLGFCLPLRATPEQKRLAGLFRPHVARALEISNLIELRTAEAEDLAAAVEGLAAGVVLVRDDLAIAGSNSAADRLLRRAGAGLRAERGRLFVTDRNGGAELRAVLAAGAAGQLDRAGASILFDDDHGRPALLARVMPLERPSARRAPRAVAAIFLTSPAAPPPPTPMQAFVKRYGLTPSETSVLTGLMEGKSPRAIAAMRGIGMPTVRTHLSRLYDKTGTTGQAGIVRLMSGAGPMI